MVRVHILPSKSLLWDFLLKEDCITVCMERALHEGLRVTPLFLKIALLMYFESPTVATWSKALAPCYGTRAGSNPLEGRNFLKEFRPISI